MERKNMESSDEEDVFENIDQATQSFIAGEIMEKTPGNAGGERVQRWVSNVAQSPTSCRIVVGWNTEEVDIMVGQSCSQTVLCLVEIAQTKVKFFVSFVDASNSCVERRSLWNELNMHKCSVNRRAWVLMGDFNVTLKHVEHSNGSSNMSIDMHDFNDAVNTMEVEDICSSGFNFTWTKSLKNAMCSTLKKLDRIMINKNFLMKFEKAHGIFLPYLVSDHCPAIMTIPKGISKKKKSFRFANYVADKKDFLDVVREVNALKEKLKDAQIKVDANPSNLEKRKNAVNIMNEYTQVAEDELKLLHQKAKVRWLEEGDKNTSYFHNIIKTRKHKNRIETICCEDGKRVKGKMINDQFVNHFQTFLGTSYPVCPLSSMGDIAVLKLPEEEANDMIKNVSDKEIKDALFDIDSNKAAGPDGYNSCFFKKAWDIIGIDICLAVKEFFVNGKILGEINETLIALILTNRIKGGLSKVVSLNQSAFIPGRHIQDNILITQELLKGYNRKNGPKRCAMKIDIQKAYDTINWDFLKEVLLMVGGRGLRQGDPISPYLFTLVMEVFNMIMIKNIREDGKFKYHHGCKDIKLTHMCFADDLMVLCNGDTDSLNVVKKSLDEFSSVSGLFPNLSKMKDCQNLLDNVESRINCWRNKLLSYAGRIQLIASVLSAMHQYWASVYILPLTVMNELEKTFQKFLWNPRGSVKGKARVAWKFVCRPKEQGGRGFKPLQRWNEVLLISQLWKLIDKKESLWVKWVNSVKLKGKSIWEAVKIGDVWHDKWCDIGPLDRYPSLNQLAVPSLSMEKDRAQWLCEGNKVMDYNTKAAWLTMRDNWPKVDWCKVVWYSQCSPKQVVILWMAIQRKLMTQDRMCWMHGDTLKCSLWDGRSISVWHDKLCDIGPLDRYIQSRDIYDTRMSNLDCLADAISNGRWKWADEWSNSSAVVDTTVFGSKVEGNVARLVEPHEYCEWGYILHNDALLLLDLAIVVG
ncbi:RNA-directed DNA polymerase, eukaryota, reverse transcriptase zinc-binding domain protein [Tanacetum coccineum]